MVGSLVAAIIFFVFGFVYENNASDILEIGKKAPKADLKMTDVSGEDLSLNDLADENGLLVIFSCNDCPFVIGRGDKEGWEDRYPKYSKMTSKNKVGMVLVNSNEAKRPGIDSIEEMKTRARDKKYTSSYVLDKDSKLADAFGAKTTPHVFLFNSDMELVYKGAIDDNVNSSKEVKEYYLENALNALIKGEKIDPNSTKNIGCSIKRVKT
ncbi:MAG: thioredoxin family protein [Flavobacteriales bacterium]|nr:thioredoxin family protein [Flavobacteriales bacterium]